MLGDKRTKKQLDGKLGIGELLRDIRKQKNLTLSEVSEKTGFSEETIRRLELDQFEPKLSTLEMLSDFYRLDLVELIARKRSYNSLFSEELISEVNKLINNFNGDEIRTYAEQKIMELNKLSQVNQIKAKDAKTSSPALLAQFLDALKNIKLDYHGNHAANIVTLENILLSISPKFNTPEAMDFPIAIEISITIYLSFLYRQAREYIKAAKLLEGTIERIKQLPFINDRFSDYLAAAYLNLAYAYHSLGDHEKVIHAIDTCLSDNKVSFTRIAMSQLLFRKGIALHETSSPDGQSYLKTSLSLMNPQEMARLKKLLQDQYRIEV